MSESERYWNEDAQQWEERGGRGTPVVTDASRTTASKGRLGASRSVDLRALVAAVVAIGVVVVVVVALATKGPSGEESKKPASSDSPSPSDSPLPTDSGSPSPSATGPPPGGDPSSLPSTPPAPGVPDGYEAVADPTEGFSTVIPQGWRRVEHYVPGSDLFTVTYKDRAVSKLVEANQVLRVLRLSEPTVDESVKDLTEFAGNFSSPPDPKPFHSGALHGKRMEYVLTEPSGPRPHRVDIHFKADDGNLYRVLVEHDGGDAQRARWRATSAAEHFCSPNASCGRLGSP
ncbi:photosystem II reaction center PsbP family protein [Streptomyces sp. P38-E01]|uniref:Photosystem II reaction center PsbP family protein n=1 Tax=Streptomyces tardus TaxID=2780544 RepID=A0A949JD70_9ACTN|nr:hypothetical protein [Streptomyces tardus]MBU7596249.1 photosystem II reaction center PsbP family protein [Streptomyces tardus]